MILDCLKGWPVRKEASLLVGDMPHDLQAAAAAGIAGYFSKGAILNRLSEPDAGEPGVKIEVKASARSCRLWKTRHMPPQRQAAAGTMAILTWQEGFSVDLLIIQVRHGPIWQAGSSRAFSLIMARTPFDASDLRFLKPNT